MYIICIRDDDLAWWYDKEFFDKEWKKVLIKKKNEYFPLKIDS
jgi:hypothetical protein